MENKMLKRDEKMIKNIKNNFINKIIKYIIVFFAGVLIFVLGVKLSSHFTMQTKTTKLGLKDVGELVTQTCTVTIVQDNKNNREFFKLFKLPFTESRQIFSYDFEVDASIDFEKIKYNIYDKEKKIIIKVPQAKIYKSRMLPKSLKVYLDEESLFSNIDMKETNDAFVKMEKDAVNNCKKNGLIENADKNAESLIRGIIKGNDRYRDYKIEFK